MCSSTLSSDAATEAEATAGAAEALSERQRYGQMRMQEQRRIAPWLHVAAERQRHGDAEAEAEVQNKHMVELGCILLDWVGLCWSGLDWDVIRTEDWH